MNVVIFGATGMVGQGVLRECLLDPNVESVLTVGRTASGVQHPKLRDIVHPDLWNYGAIEARLSGLDACYFCLGVTSNGMTEEAYERVTYGIAVGAGEVLARLNPQMTFVFVSGAGADSSGQGRLMWARIKGKTENALLRLPFAAVYVFRPAFIQPSHGERSRTALYNFLYTFLRPFVPLLRRALPNYVLTTEQIGQAMLAITRSGYSKHVLESRDIRDVHP